MTSTEMKLHTDLYSSPVVTPTLQWNSINTANKVHRIYYICPLNIYVTLGD